MGTDSIYEDEFLRTYYPSSINSEGRKQFSIICTDPSQSIDSMILWQGLNFLFLSDNKIQFIYVGADPDNPSPGVFDEVERHFKEKVPSPILLFKKKADKTLEFLGMYYVLSRTSDQKSLERFRTINSNIRDGYHLQSVLTLVEYKYLEENRKFIPISKIEISDALRNWILQRQS